MKQKLIISAIMLMFCITLYAEDSGTCGENLTWELDDNGTLTISGNGEMTNYSYSENCAPWNRIIINRMSIKTIIINYGVTSIGDYAFYCCTNLTSVTIPNSITYIGSSAFYDCRGLTSLTIPNSVTNIGDYALKGVQNIEYNGIATGSPWGAKSVNGFVDEYLVYNDSSRTNLLGCSSAIEGELTIPNSVISIGDSAFDYCRGLTLVTIGNSVTSIGKSAFNYCVRLTSITIPNSVTSIGDRAFYNCNHLTSVNIPNSVTSIGDDAFSSCSGLTSVNIENSVTSIGNSAFYNCTSLTSINMGNSITSIGRYSFSQCSSLTTVSIPNSVTSIGDFAFCNCTNLTSVNIPNSVTSIKIKTFDNCSNLNSVTWNVENNGDFNSSPFSASSQSISTFVFGNNVKVIPAYLCNNFGILKSVTIPNNVENIGDYSFYNCSEVETVTIGESIKSIGKNAFAGCKRITDIYCYAERVPDVSSNSSDDSFKDVSRKAILWVPANRLRNYTIDEYWGQFDVQPMQSNEVNTDKVVIKTDNNTTEMIWPKVDGVNSYDITITDTNGNTICVLTFNADGQLQNISFKAPSIVHNNAPQQAQSTGFSFTITGLDANTTYKYYIEAKDISNTIIKTFEGEFTTDGGIYDSLEEIENENNTIKTQKIYEKGQVIIVTPNGKKFNVNGVEIK